MDDCKDCFKIVCRKCGWTPNEGELARVLKKELTLCPVCSWQPGMPVL